MDCDLIKPILLAYLVRKIVFKGGIMHMFRFLFFVSAASNNKRALQKIWNKTMFAKDITLINMLFLRTYLLQYLMFCFGVGMHMSGS